VSRGLLKGLGLFKDYSLDETLRKLNVSDNTEIFLDYAIFFKEIRDFQTKNEVEIGTSKASYCEIY